MFGFGSRGQTKTLSPPDVFKSVKSGEIWLIDVREASEWKSGRIPGALHRPLSRFADWADNLPKDRPIVLYCLSGARSAKALSLCRKRGLGHDTHMAGGINAWLAHGLPLER
ncbi:putative adenylyltransferase/sulfurtransferase MoeZ [Hartmannibacter diazotrophicus]|uniref:Putative adenylyltransferase/sulfurtransferase MoeZ n=1 Tax=Hartmannibacter diazotrophicus TaxID=1482074 RepID=A0A2C9D3L8_9HYPH|nr:rhodanese-like domain-containing protein [Hartmannibacter diazotrophicus]SON54779.1 putative adenylyltransferase/sulfurtransferase MoeZ [Hartmannibacter diazotrophicus]